ncbi:MAG TPA: stage II sporulation protein M [Polyangia bacterium]|jgi:uncharacterized membrane protein SpoIIM required for sporulation|nr:stage II sporulation protein M [Polyangia bacterium]
MLTQDEFIARRQRDWDRLADLLGQDRALHHLPPADIAETAALYRAVCADLMRARGAGYAANLVAYLDGLAGRGHNAFYSAPPHRLAALWELVARDFPIELRKSGRFMAFAAALFLLPAVLGFVGALASPSFAATVLPSETLAEMEEAYSQSPSAGRDLGTNSMMAGFYINNNIGIAFRCFATGVFFGLGSVFFLVYNGLLIGTVFGFITRLGHGLNILTFCAGHSPFELTAIVISGAAGLRLGYALIETGGRTRWGSLRTQAPDIARLVFGAALMLLVAAFIEGYWSPSSVPPLGKRGVAVLLVVLVTAYLLCAGRRAEGRARPSEAVP